MVADLETVLLVSPGPVGGPFHIAELHLVHRFGDSHIHREADLQKAVQLVPLDSGVEFHPDGAAFQGNNLGEGGIADFAADFHSAAVGVVLHKADAGAAAAFHKLLLIGAVDIPGVEHTGHILVKEQAVHAAGGKFPAALLEDKGGHLAVCIQNGPHLAVFQHSAFRGDGNMDCFFGSKAVIFSRRIAAGGDGHPGVAAVGFFHYSVPVPGQGVEDQLILAAAGDGASRSVGQGGPGRDNLVMQLLGLFVDRRNGGSGQDIVELVQEHLFPVGVPFRIRERKAVLHGQGAPHFGLPESQLGFPVAFFHRSLAGVNAPVAGEIKLAHIGVLRAAFRFQVLEDLAGMGHFKFGAAFQILFPQGELDVIPAGTTAAVAVAVRQQEFVQAVLLDPVVPNVNELFGVGGIGVVGGQVGNNLAAVHALPGEVVVGELVAAVVAPEDLLGHQVLDAAAL